MQPTPQYRPAFHFSPATGWMNDPNGLVYDDGVYHLFFQHYPDDNIWGPMHWGHATSRDLLTWEEQTVALFPDDLGMIFSGSIVIDNDNSSGLSRNGRTPWIALFTHHEMAGEKAGSERYQHQSIAVSHDKGQIWEKYAGNPVIPNPGIKNFRDPKVFWHEETRRWIMVLAGGDRILFYVSANLLDWELASELTSFDVAEGNVLECPDLIRFDLNGKSRWVLLVSVYTGGPNGGSGTHYVVGDFDGRQFMPEHQDIRWLDYGPDNYAGVSFHNAPGQESGKGPLLIGWMSNWAYAQVVPTHPWRSAMTLPRELELVEVAGQARLRQRVAAEVPESARLRLAASDLLNHQLQLSNDKGDEVLVGYDHAARTYYIDRRASGLTDFSDKFPIRATAPALGEPEDVEVIIDACSVELFADGGATVMSALIFPRAALENGKLISNR